MQIRSVTASAICLDRGGEMLKSTGRGGKERRKTRENGQAGKKEEKKEGKKEEKKEGKKTTEEAIYETGDKMNVMT
jgi:hypothetical protein